MKRFLIIAALLSLFLSSCDKSGKKEPEQVEGEVEFLSQKGRWTYISLENATIVGTGILGDSSSDAAWAARDDWDIAICDSLIRTNGGSSGIGKGQLSGESSAKLALDEYQEIW